MRKKNNMRHRGGHRGGGRYQGGGGGGRGGNEQQNLARQKHHALQMREKYTNMARDAQVNGDRVDVEYYLQHVDHYTRVLSDIGAIEAERYAQQREQQVMQDGTGGNPETDGNTEGGGDEEGLNTPGNQPRMTRPQPQPRAPGEPQQQASASSPGGGNEIPLPGSVLTAL